MEGVSPPRASDEHSSSRSAPKIEQLAHSDNDYGEWGLRKPPSMAHCAEVTESTQISRSGILNVNGFTEP